jgi:hypothetical protein
MGRLCRWEVSEKSCKVSGEYLHNRGTSGTNDNENINGLKKRRFSLLVRTSADGEMVSSRRRRLFSRNSPFQPVPCLTLHSANDWLGCQITVSIAEQTHLENSLSMITIDGLRIIMGNAFET